MRIELWIILISAGIIYNIYTDGKYIKLLQSHKKYIKIAFICFFAFSLYIMTKRNPNNARNMLLYTNNMIKYMPIDRSSMDLITPIFDLSHKNESSSSFMNDLNMSLNPNFQYNPIVEHRNTMTQKPTHKRSVSETKKKFVAYNQDWKCGKCSKKLSYTFEVDHKLRLEHGGTNDVNNLVALCRECHGEKTALENM